MGSESGRRQQLDLLRSHEDSAELRLSSVRRLSGLWKSRHERQVGVNIKTFISFYLISCSPLRLWDTKNNECIKKYRGHIANVNSVKFSPDGSWIASAGTEGRIA